MLSNYHPGFPHSTVEDLKGAGNVRSDHLPVAATLPATMLQNDQSVRVVSWNLMHSLAPTGFDNQEDFSVFSHQENNQARLDNIKQSLRTILYKKCTGGGLGLFAAGRRSSSALGPRSETLDNGRVFSQLEKLKSFNTSITP